MIARMLMPNPRMKSPVVNGSGMPQLMPKAIGFEARVGDVPGRR